MAETPQTIDQPASSYKVPNAWEVYSLNELGQWIHLLVKRAHHRFNGEKRSKDLQSAQNYLNLMQVVIDEAVSRHEYDIHFYQYDSDRRFSDEHRKEVFEDPFLIDMKKNIGDREIFATKRTVETDNTGKMRVKVEFKVRNFNKIGLNE